MTHVLHVFAVLEAEDAPEKAEADPKPKACRGVVILWCGRALAGEAEGQEGTVSLKLLNAGSTNEAAKDATPAAALSLPCKA